MILNTNNITALALGNQAVRDYRYSDAIKYYNEAIQKFPELEKIVSANIEFAASKIKKNRANKQNDAPSRDDQEKIESATNRPLKAGYKFAIVVHYYYPDIWDEIKVKLEALPCVYDLYITAHTDKAEFVIKNVLSSFPLAKIYLVQNIGMDIGPFLSLIPVLANEGYLAVCKLHTKRGDSDLATIWRRVMIDSLIGSPKNFMLGINAFIENPEVSAVGPNTLYQSGPRLIYDNKNTLCSLNKKILGHDSLPDHWGFFAGTMFWIRIESIIDLCREVNLSKFATYTEYQKDGKLEHAVERYFGLMLTAKKMKIGLLMQKSTQISDVHLLTCAPNEFVGKADIGRLMRQIIKLQEDRQCIDDSKLLDKEYYLLQYPLLRNTNVDIVIHYLTHGTFCGAKPNEYFSPDEYRKLNQDVVNAHMEPFVHYLKFGAIEKRRYRLEKKIEDVDCFYFRYMALNYSLINWRTERDKPRKKNLASIIIPVHGQIELLNACIQSILSSKCNTQYEIILVDNYCNNEITESLRQLNSRHKNIKIVFHKENYNFAVGCNTGISYASGYYIIFLNSDTTVTNGWLDSLVDRLNNPNIVAVQPKLLYPDGKVQCAGVVFSRWSQIGYPIYSNFNGADPVVNFGRSFQALTGACLGTRANDFLEIRGFDPIFINGQEDIDLCLRLRKDASATCWYEPASVVFHHEGKSTGRGRHVHHNRQMFIKRWGADLLADDEVYYQHDRYFIREWNLDSVGYLEHKIQTYRPILEKSNIERIDTDSFALPFKIYNFDNWTAHNTPLDSIIHGEIPENPNRINVLVCAHASGTKLFGGERSFLDMLDALQYLAVNIYVTLPSAANPLYIAEILRKCASVIVFKYDHWAKNKILHQPAIARFKAICKKFCIDLIHVNTIMIREPLIAGKEIGIKTIIHVREQITYDEHLSTSIGLHPDEILGNLSKCADLVIANSNSTGELFANFPRVIIAKNVVDTDKFDIPNNIQSNCIKFGIISSNLPKKGINDFYELAKLCENKIVNAIFYIIGPLDGPDAEFARSLKLRTEKEGTPKNLKFIGYKDNPIDAIGIVNVVLNLSHFSESFGRTICEAQAARRAVIVYRHGALPELVENGINGFIAEFQNVQQIALYVEKLCSNPELIIKMGEAGRRSICQNYSHRRLSFDFSSAYKNLLIDEDFHSSLAAPQMPKNTYLDILISQNIPLNFNKTAVTIIIPIYNAVQELMACIGSVRANTLLKRNRLLLIDDSSTDSNVSEYLKSLEGICNIEILRNQVNQGYTKTINIAIRHVKEGDIVLLNSDTIVTPGWILGLRAVAHSKLDAGTVTAMSDNAGVFSFPAPSVSNPKPVSWTHADYALHIISSCSKMAPISLPTGNGFCMYITRKLISSIGLFDEKNFPIGYGEENDYCMRAIQKGFSNYLSPWSFVYHVKSASFQEKKYRLLEDGAKKLSFLHPSYNKMVQNAFSSPEIKSLRNHIAESIKKATQVQSGSSSLGIDSNRLP